MNSPWGNKVHPLSNKCFDSCFSSVRLVVSVEYNGESKKIIIRIIRFSFIFGFLSNRDATFLKETGTRGEDKPYPRDKYLNQHLIITTV